MSAEEQIHFDNIIKRIEYIFRYVGINIKSGIQTARSFKCSVIFFINFMWTIASISGGIYMVVDGVQTGKDFLELTPIAPCITFATLATVKALYLVLNESYVHKLMYKMRALELKDKHRLNSKKTDEIKNKERNFLNFIVTVATGAYTVCIIAFALSTILIILFKYYTTGEVDLVLPYKIKYPFDAHTWKTWPFVYVHQVWTSIVTSLDIAAGDYFFFICCIYMRIQFRLLRNELENLIPDTNDLSVILRHDDNFRVKFRELVIWHKDILGSADLLEIIYTRSTLFNFLSSSMLICLTGFNMMMGSEVTVLINYMTFLTLGLVQIFFLCYFADLLISSSLEISDGVYQSKWYLADSRVGKSLLIMQIRSQIPCKLTASGFAEVNLNSFMRVLSTAWSYFALLQTMYGST